jgi:hypothetical protein
VNGDGFADGLHLGRTRGSFSGTDALGFAVHPDAVRWATDAVLPRYVLGEGARLGTSRFLAALHARTDLLVVLLVADDETLDARSLAEGRNQSRVWRIGAATRAHRAAAVAGAAGVRVIRVSTDRDPGDTLGLVQRALGWWENDDGPRPGQGAGGRGRGD